MYLTGSQLATDIGIDELALIVSGRVKRDVVPDVLQAFLDSADTSGFLDNLVADAHVAHARIEQSLSASSKLISGYVSSVYPAGLTQDVINDSVLPKVAVSLTKYDLMVATDEETRLQYKDAMSQLRDIKNGAISLGPSDPKPKSSGLLHTGRGVSQFDFGGFGR